jgi:hypothetical protein
MSNIISVPVEPRELALDDVRRCVMREAAIRRSFDHEIERITQKITEKKRR